MKERISNKIKSQIPNTNYINTQKLCSTTGLFENIFRLKFIWYLKFVIWNLIFMDQAFSSGDCFIHFSYIPA